MDEIFTFTHSVFSFVHRLEYLVYAQSVSSENSMDKNTHSCVLPAGGGVDGDVGRGTVPWDGTFLQLSHLLVRYYPPYSLLLDPLDHYKSICLDDLNPFHTPLPQNTRPLERADSSQHQSSREGDTASHCEMARCGDKLISREVKGCRGEGRLVGGGESAMSQD